MHNSGQVSSALRSAPHWGALISFVFLVSGCEDQDLYREMGGMGNYAVVRHESFPSCEAEPQLIPGSACIQVLPRSDVLWLQNCDSGREQLDLAVELARQGQAYELTSIDVELCADYCIGGVSTGCTSNCPGGHSCDMTALRYRASLDLDRRRLHLELTRHAQVRLPVAASADCSEPMLADSAVQAACSQLDVFDASWEPSQN